MFFKNLRLYRLEKTFALDPEQLHEKLKADAFKPCGSLALSSIGWTPPLGRWGSQLTHAAADSILIAVRKEERLLPAAVVAERLEEKTAEIEERQNRKVGRKERTALKEEIIQSLLPRSFTKSGYTFAYIMPKERWIVVDATSPAKAEELLSLLRRSLGSLPVVPLQTQASASGAMTAWISGQPAPAGVELGDECELKEPGQDGGQIRGKRVDLLSDEIGHHLETGKQVVKLALRFDERLSFTLGDDISIKRLTFEDTVREALQDAEGEDETTLFDAQFALMTLEVGGLLRVLPNWFGGEAKPE